MAADERDELSRDEKAAYEALRVDRAPTPGLEDRIVEDLTARGLLAAEATAAARDGAGRVGPSLPVWRLARAAAIIVALGAAFLLGRGSAPPVGDPGAYLMNQPTELTFALLVYETPENWPLPDTRQAYDETSQWIATLIADGVCEGGARLQDSASLVAMAGGSVVPVAGPPADATRILAGFILITAPDRDEAERIAATSPLIRYGSSIEVREILPD